MNWADLRKHFPITRKLIYLDHASGGPLPKPVYDQIQNYYQEHLAKGDLYWNTWVRRREEVRAAVARFINADPSEITFTQSTSQGMNLIAEILANEGPVLLNKLEFPASTLPWIWRKANILWQEPEEGGLSLETTKRLMGSVKTIVTSFVQYATGFRQDLEALGKIKGNRYLVVNATQGFGAFPIDVKKWKLDFLCTNSYKWLLAGYGGGVLYIHKKWLAKFRSSSIGWRSMNQPEFMDNQRIDVKPEASRYEFGCPSFPTIFGVGAAVEYLSKIGLQKIEARILELTDLLVKGLEQQGREVVSPRAPKHRSGIVVFKAANAAEIAKRLLGQKIYTSPRGAGLRIAPHFYNTPEEIRTLLHALKT